MGSKAAWARRRAAEIRKELKWTLGFFCLGLALAELAIWVKGDRFMPELSGGDLGRLPVYLLLGAAAGGLYTAVKFVGEKNQEQVTVKSAILNGQIYLFLSGMVVLLSPLAFLPGVFYKCYQLGKLQDTINEEAR